MLSTVHDEMHQMLSISMAEILFSEVLPQRAAVVSHRDDSMAVKVMEQFLTLLAASYLDVLPSETLVETYAIDIASVLRMTLTFVEERHPLMTRNSRRCWENIEDICFTLATQAGASLATVNIESPFWLFSSDDPSDRRHREIRREAVDG